MAIITKIIAKTTNIFTKNAQNEWFFKKIIIKKEKIMEEKEKMKKKTADERAENHEADNLLNYIIGSTFARHSKLNEEEFLKEIGFENSGKNEDEAIRIAMFNVLVATTNELIKAKQSIKMAHSLMKTCLIDEKIVEDEKKGE